MLKKISIGIGLILSVSSAFACTDFASMNGANHSVLIAKNRDMYPGLQSIVAFHPKQGANYMGLMFQSQPGASYAISAGINQYGLSVVDMATSVLKGYPGFVNHLMSDGFMRAVLIHDRSIDEVIRDLPGLANSPNGFPDFYLLADAHKIVMIEIAPQGQYSVVMSTSAPLYHTNHYITPGFEQYNVSPDSTSLVRYTRIAALMNSRQVYTVDDFFNFAHDTNAGNWSSIFRTGKNLDDPGTPRTLATFIASIPKNGSAPTVNIQFYPIAKTTEPIYTYVLNTQFWDFPGTEKVLAKEAQVDSQYSRLYW